MSFAITFYGGALVMMGQHTRSESLFYYFRIEDHIPEDHLLRLVTDTSTLLSYARP